MPFESASDIAHTFVSLHPPGSSFHRLSTSWPASGRTLRVLCRVGLQPLHQHEYKHTQQNYLQYLALTRALASEYNTSYSILHTPHPTRHTLCQSVSASEPSGVLYIPLAFSLHNVILTLYLRRTHTGYNTRKYLI